MNKPGLPVQGFALGMCKTQMIFSQKMEQFPTTKLHSKISLKNSEQHIAEHTGLKTVHQVYSVLSSAELLKYVILDEVQQ